MTATNIFANDFHVHTHHSPCWNGGRDVHPLRQLAYAESMGVRVVGFTNHFTQDPDIARTLGRTPGPELTAHLREELRDNHTSVRVLIGCEADQMTPDAVSIGADYARELDYVMVSASHFDMPGVAQPASMEPPDVAEHFLAFLRRALQQEFVSIIAHPFFSPGRRWDGYEAYMAQIEDRSLYEIAELAQHNRVAMETGRALMTYPPYLRAAQRFFRICREVGVRFTFGSDTHYLAYMGPDDGVLSGIKGLGLTPEDYLSAEEVVTKSWH
ncbi:MAG: hypothetical protein IT330_18940 [Anaerolineae bacterium]|nr:hypothetical protein [Anaerolineae bacterium]